MSELLRIFIGIDKRQPVAYHVLCSSIQRRCSRPVSFTPLIIDQLPIDRVGLTDFTFARYLVPYLCNYEGKALFIDSDILLNSDINNSFFCLLNDSGEKSYVVGSLRYLLSC